MRFAGKLIPSRAIRFVAIPLGLVAACFVWFYISPAGFALFPDKNTLLVEETSQERMELHFYINGPESSYLPDPEEDYVRQAIEEKFNVSLSLTVMEPGDGFTRSLASLLIANNPPDMWLSLESDGGAKYALDNVLADMTLFISPSTMPNYFRYWINETELREFQFHNKFMRAPLPYDKNSYRAYYIRQDWLDRVGLEVPESYEKYIQVLEAFTFDDPDGNGSHDTYGFTTSGNGSELSTDWPEYGKNSLLFPAYYENQRLIDMQMDVKIEEVVNDILKVINSGLVEPDWFLNKGQDYVDKAVQGKAGVVLGHTKDFALDANPNSLQSRSREKNPNANWVPFNPLGDQPLRVEPSPESAFLFSNITAGLHPEKLKKTAEILDWLAGEEGFLLTHYGQEGRHYTRQGNVLTVIPETVLEDMADKGNSSDIWGFFTPDTPEVFGLNVEDGRQSERDLRIIDFLADIPVRKGVGTTLTPPLRESEESMRTRQKELQVRMLFTDRSGEHWPVYRQEILDDYNGGSILRHYEDKIRAARRNR